MILRIFFISSATIESHNFDVDALSGAFCAIKTFDYCAVGFNSVSGTINEQDKDILDYFLEDDLDFIDND